MSDSETNILDEIQTTDDAFLSAVTPKRLDDLELQPFSLQRQLISRELNSSPNSSKLYDAILTVWVCTLTKEQLLDCRRDMAAAVDEAFQWAESRGYSLDEHSPLMDLYDRIQAEIKVSGSARPKNSGEPAKNDGGPQE